jgi:hypothetical protein
MHIDGGVVYAMGFCRAGRTTRNILLFIVCVAWENLVLTILGALLMYYAPPKLYDSIQTNRASTVLVLAIHAIEEATARIVLMPVVERAVDHVAHHLLRKSRKQHGPLGDLSVVIDNLRHSRRLLDNTPSLLVRIPPVLHQLRRYSMNLIMVNPASLHPFQRSIPWVHALHATRNRA